MIEFLQAQPVFQRDRLLALLQAESVSMAVMLNLEFRTTPVRISNRNVPFTDVKYGYEWQSGAGLLVELPQVTSEADSLAPFREFRLGMPEEWIEAESWRADIVAMIRDQKEYRKQPAQLLGQVFDPDTGEAVGHPFVFDTGLMDRMSVSFSPGGAVLSLTVESFFARKGVPVYGMITYQDQKRRHPTDEGAQFTAEAGAVVEWTNW